MSLGERLRTVQKDFRKAIAPIGITIIVATAACDPEGPFPNRSTSSYPNFDKGSEPSVLVENGLTNNISCILPTIEQLKHVARPAPLATNLWGGAQASFSDGVYIKGYNWDFKGDGEWNKTVQIDPTFHIYEEAGIYNPKYRVQGSDGSLSKTCDSFPIVVK